MHLRAAKTEGRNKRLLRVKKRGEAEKKKNFKAPEAAMKSEKGRRRAVTSRESGGKLLTLNHERTLSVSLSLTQPARAVFSLSVPVSLTQHASRSCDALDAAQRAQAAEQQQEQSRSLSH